jgi:hypothetical protein
MRYLALVITLVLLYSCNGDSLPAGIIEPQKMENILWDKLRADAYCSEIIARRNDSINDTLENIKYLKLIFEKHKVSKESFDQSFHYYNKHPEIMSVIMDSIIAKQNRTHFKIDVKRQKVDFSL